MIRFLAVALFVGSALLGSIPAQAGKYNRKLSIGDKAPAFTGLQGVDGKTHGLDDYQGKDFVVLIIICNECPVAQSYESRIVALAKKYASADTSKVAVVALSVSVEPDDQIDKMQVRAKAKGYNFPYLSDPTQKIGRALGASVTPEVFVLDKNRKVIYMGGVDDSQAAAKVTKKYLEEALDAALAGKPIPVPETRPVGCSVEYVKK